MPRLERVIHDISFVMFSSVRRLREVIDCANLSCDRLLLIGPVECIGGHCAGQSVGYYTYKWDIKVTPVPQSGPSASFSNRRHLAIDCSVVKDLIQSNELRGK